MNTKGSYYNELRKVAKENLAKKQAELMGSIYIQQLLLNDKKNKVAREEKICQNIKAGAIFSICNDKGKFN